MESIRVISIKPSNSIYSDSEIKIIPLDPKVKPLQDKIEEVTEFLKKEYPDKEITSELFYEPKFIDPGELFEQVKCNLCGQIVDNKDWQEKMDKSFEKSKFEDLEIIMNCCGNISSLNNLTYEWDCGFASYVISINNPDLDKDKENKIRVKLSEILGFEVKLFWSKT